MHVVRGVPTTTDPAPHARHSELPSPLAYWSISHAAQAAPPTLNWPVGHELHPVLSLFAVVPSPQVVQIVAPTMLV